MTDNLSPTVEEYLGVRIESALDTLAQYCYEVDLEAFELRASIIRLIAFGVKLPFRVGMPDGSWVRVGVDDEDLR